MTVYNTLVDKVAEAISQSFREEGYIEGLSDPSEWEEFRKAAREVLLAISKFMLDEVRVSNK